MKKKEGKYGLLKGVLIFFAILVVFSWLIPNGTFGSSGLVSDGMARIGLNDISWVIYYALTYLVIDKALFLLVIGGLYGVLIKSGVYARVVDGLAKCFSKNKELTVILTSVIIALFTSVLSSVFAVIIFIPLIVSVLNKMKLDKITIFSATFGSILVGILGATLGTEGIGYLSSYFAVEGQSAHDVIYATIIARAGVLVVALALFNFFTINRMRSVKAAEETEIFVIEEDKNMKKRSLIPFIVIGVLIFALVILGFVDWNNSFLVDTFDNFHNTLLSTKIGSDFYVISDLLGEDILGFGHWSEDLLTVTPILLLFTIILGLCYRLKFNEFIEAFINGAKRMIKPCLCIFGAFTVMIVVYKSPYMATIADKILNLTEGFNLITMIITAFIMNIVHADLGLTGYTLGGYFIAQYADYINPIFVIFTTIFGLVQFFIPTSVVMGIGLTALNVKYSDWLKHIWKFLVGMFICLLVIFILLTII